MARTRYPSQGSLHTLMSRASHSLTCTLRIKRTLVITAVLTIHTVVGPARVASAYIQNVPHLSKPVAAPASASYPGWLNIYLRCKLAV